jgi:hypothetical protein
MGRRYVITASNVTVAGTTTLIFLNPGTTRTLKVVEWEVSQRDATSRQQAIRMVRQVSVFPTLTSATPVALDPSDATSAITGGGAGAAGTCGINASNEGAGAKTTTSEHVFNVLNGYKWLPMPGGEIVLPASSSSGFGLHFPVAPTVLTGWTATLTYEEC